MGKNDHVEPRAKILHPRVRKNTHSKGLSFVAKEARPVARMERSSAKVKVNLSLSLSQPLLQSLLKRSLNEVLNPLEKELKKLEYLSKQNSERGREQIVCSGHKFEESPNEKNYIHVTDARPRQCSALRSKFIAREEHVHTHVVCTFCLSPVHYTEHCCIR